MQLKLTNHPATMSFCAVLALIFPLWTCRCQEPERPGIISSFSGHISLTNNGISQIPTFSLGKPAVIFNLYMGGKKLTFEPELRFSLEGKPWSFLFWWRYKAVDKKNFSMRLGMHPALNFKTITVDSNGSSREVIAARRFLAGEMVPEYSFSENTSVGMYYLYSRGFDDTTGNTYFLVLNAAFTNIHLNERYSLGFVPQVYYLKLDEEDGFYATAFISLAKRDFPLSLTSVMNKRIKIKSPRIRTLCGI